MQKKNLFTRVKAYLAPQYSKTVFMAYTSVFIALFIILSYFNISLTPTIEIRFGYFASFRDLHCVMPFWVCATDSSSIRKISLFSAPHSVQCANF